MTDKISEFLLKNQYSFSVKPIPKGVELKVPEIRLKAMNHPAKTIKYTIRRGKKSKVIIDDGQKNSVELPEYVIKLFIEQQILSQCVFRSFNFDYLEVLDKAGNKLENGILSLDRLIKSPRGEHRVKEDKLAQLIQQYTLSGELNVCRELANQENILEGFDLIIGLLMQARQFLLK